MGLGRDVSLAQLRPHYHAVVLVSDSPIYILHTFLLCVFVCVSVCVCVMGVVCLLGIWF